MVWTTDLENWSRRTSCISGLLLPILFDTMTSTLVFTWRSSVFWSRIRGKIIGTLRSVGWKSAFEAGDARGPFGVVAARFASNNMRPDALSNEGTLKSCRFIDAEEGYDVIREGGGGIIHEHDRDIFFFNGATSSVWLFAWASSDIWVGRAFYFPSDLERRL